MNDSSPSKMSSSASNTAKQVRFSDLLPTPLDKASNTTSQSNISQPSWRRFFAKTGLKSILAGLFLLLLVAGSVAAMVLVQLNQDTRQQASGFVYDKCDYGNNNEKPVCLDSEPTYGNCVICKNGEKHVLPNAECGNNLCAKPQPKTCTDGNNNYNEGGTACNSYTDCLKCVDGHWVSTDRWNCSQGSTCYAAEPTKPPPTSTPRPTVTTRPSVTAVPTVTPRLSLTPLPSGTIRPTTTPRPTVTPRLSPTLTSNLFKDGTRCNTNTQCQSGSCVPTPYGYYCGPTSSTKCKAGESKCGAEGGISYTYSCNLNGFFEKSSRCDGGCNGNSCRAGVCSPGKSECDGNAVKTCNSTGTAWTKQSCWSGQMCVLGNCIASPFASNTPRPTATPVPKLGDGSRCNTNAQCSSGSCVPTPYGYYCGTTTSPKCTVGKDECRSEGGTSYVYSCNANGFYVKSERCDGGCSGGMCIPGVCKPGEKKCDGYGVATCNSAGTALAHASCQSGKVCQNGECVNGSIPACTFAGTCTGNSFCEGSNDYYYRCVNNHWEVQVSNKPVKLSDSCNEYTMQSVIYGLSKVPEIIKDYPDIRITCKANPDHPTYQGWTPSNSVEADFFLNCGAGGMQCDNVVVHEMAHRWAYDATGQFNVNSFSKKIGCVQSDDDTYHFDEPAVSAYGSKSCVEAFAESVRVFIFFPCKLKKDYPKQYDWMVNDSSSPFQNEEKCNN